MKLLIYFGRGLIILMATMIGVVSLRYLDFKVSGILQDKGALLGSKIYLLGFYTHIIFGVIALLSGPWQFISSFRNKFLRFHKNLGKIYFLACLLSGVAGFGIAWYAEGGIIAHLGFACLGLLWLYTSLRAYKAIADGNIRAHEGWMFRSYALTLAAVTLRLWMPLLMGVLHWEFMDAYRTVAWLCWVPNVLFAEFLIGFKSRHIFTAILE